jgi:tetratricopeptide (TPR) repeat protein
MRARLPALILAALVCGPLLGDFAVAQGPATADPKAERRPLRPTAPDRGKRLDMLFEALKRAPDAEIAKAVEQRIEATMAQSGSDTADLLMVRARTALEAKDHDLAVELLDAVIGFKPDFVEAWARRATLHYVKKDIAASLADLRVVLAREPRHFGALTGLGVILQDLGEDKRALDAFRRAMAVHPHLQTVPEFIKKLEEKVEGRDI